MCDQAVLRLSPCLPFRQVHDPLFNFNGNDRLIQEQLEFIASSMAAEKEQIRGRPLAETQIARMEFKKQAQDNLEGVVERAKDSGSSMTLAVLNELLGEASSIEQCEFKFTLCDLLLTIGAPRIDEGVTLHRNHLLKSPFAVHPKTRKVRC